MNIQDYLDKMKTIQSNLLQFIDSENIEENFQNLIQILDDQKIRNNRHELKSFLYLILKISNNHHRSPDFFKKIGKILVFFSDEMKNYYSNFEIFNIFKSNKRILLLLIDEKIITIDQPIIYTITNDKYKEANYPQYFLPEIKKFNEKDIKNDLAENFEELRKSGENDNYICELIRNDSIEEFISYITEKKISLEATIEQSIFETNSFLIKNEPTLIEYTAFYGSYNIFKYLFGNGVKFTPLLWIYATHGEKFDIIHLLEENHISPKDDCDDCLIECIKCHHNDLENYIIDKFFKNIDSDHNVFLTALKYFNFAFILKEFINESSFYDLCQYDYFTLVDTLLKISDIDINSKIVQLFFLMLFLIFFVFHKISII